MLNPVKLPCFNVSVYLIAIWTFYALQLHYLSLLFLSVYLVDTLAYKLFICFARYYLANQVNLYLIYLVPKALLVSIFAFGQSPVFQFHLDWAFHHLTCCLCDWDMIVTYPFLVPLIPLASHHYNFSTTDTPEQG